MTEVRRNGFGQPIGDPVDPWRPPPPPPPTEIVGRTCVVEPLSSGHGADLFAAFSEDDGSMWTYMGYGPFPDLESFTSWLGEQAATDDPRFHAVTVGGVAVGVAAYLRIQPDVGVIEIGHISWSPRLRRTTAATEAVFLLMRRAFDELGYRRVEWKADELNAASAAAARRFGFRYEGTFRQATIYKGRNRDTAWYAMVDRDWPTVRSAIEAWLDPANFNDDGRQRRPLEVVGADRQASGPSGKNV